MVQPKLSLLIPVTWDRLAFLGLLIGAFEKQLEPFEGVERYTEKDDSDTIGYHEVITLKYCSVQIIICFDDKKMSIGNKRNELLNYADTPYIAFFDSDDLPSDCYIEEVMKGIDGDFDSCSLVGEITTDGLTPKKFIHSLEYDSWFEKDNVYYRFLNHLNVIRTSIAREIRFHDISHGEDKNYSMQLLLSGLVKTQYNIEKVIYHYKYRSVK